jgi:hypothetical protein
MEDAAHLMFDFMRRSIGVASGGSGFLAHLHSLMVTMSQKSSVLQPAKSVSQVLTPDTAVLRQSLRTTCAPTDRKQN